MDGWDPPPDFACELEYPQGKRRPVVFMHLESRGRKSTPAIRAPSSVPETRPGRKSVTLDSGTYHIVDDADDDYDRYPTYGGSYESSSSGPGSVISIQSEAEEASVEAEIIDIASTSEAVMLMLPLAPNDYVVVHSHFVGPKVTQAPAKDGSDRQSDIFEFEGDVDRAEIATGPIREWWCTGFRVAEPALEGVFPLRALKGFEEVTDL